MIYKELHSLVPEYLSELITLKTPSRYGTTSEVFKSSGQYQLPQQLPQQHANVYRYVNPTLVG